MTGYELLKYLTEVPREALEQDVIFEVLVGVNPEHVVSGHVPILEAHVSDSTRLYVPDHGLITPEQAMQNYNELKKEVAAGECTLEEIQQYMPFFCPKVISKNQVVMKLQGIKAYNDEPEPEETGAMRVSWGGMGIA